MVPRSEVAKSQMRGPKSMIYASVLLLTQQPQPEFVVSRFAYIKRVAEALVRMQRSNIGSHMPSRNLHHLACVITMYKSANLRNNTPIIIDK